MTKKKSAETQLQDTLERQPVSNVRWVHRETLKPNDYNPNRVAPAELELLVTSILEDGFTQPIVVLPNGDIVDGFHRWTVSGYDRLLQRYAGMVPVVVVDADPVHRKMSTVRHNRARGTHAILPMSEIVRTMVADGATKEAICLRLGMEDEEFDRLMDRAGNPEAAGRGFGKAWVPGAK